MRLRRPDLEANAHARGLPKGYLRSGARGWSGKQRILYAAAPRRGSEKSRALPSCMAGIIYRHL